MANIVPVDDGVYHSHSHELWSFSDKLAFVLVRFLFIQDFTIFVAFSKFFLEYSCSTVLCSFSYAAKWISYTYTCISSFPRFPSGSGTRRILSRAPCVIQQVPISCLFYTKYQQCVCVHPDPLFIPPLPSCLGVHTFILHSCVSIFCFASRFYLWNFS